MHGPTRALMLMALSAISLEAGLSYGHALQAAGKRELSAEQLLHFQTRVLGPYRMGAGIPEIGAITSAAAATWLARRERRVRSRSAASLLSMCGAFAVWASRIQPINRQLSIWNEDMRQPAPAEWARLRDEWHRLHLLRLGLLSVAAATAASAVDQAVARSTGR